MRYTHCWPWIMMKKLKNVENEKCTLQDLEYGEKYAKNWKMRNAQVYDLEYGKKIENHRK